jgi:hypothetical protein
MSWVKKIILLIYSFLIFSFFSCDIINKHETIPTYLHIDNFSLTTDFTTQGSNSINVTDAWVSVDANPEEVYELPSTFPELESGKHRLTIGPGIKINGISASRGVYPFYQSYVIDTFLVSNTVMQINPKISYKTATQFAFIENFEDPAFNFKITENSDTSILKVTDPDTTVHNNKVGAIYLDNIRKDFACATDSFDLPRTGSPIYLELSYQNNIEFNIGVYTKTTSQVIDIPVYTVFPHFQNKNKVYINLTYYINSSSSNVLYYKIYIKATNPGDVSFPVIYLDDIKLLHF